VASSPSLAPADILDRLRARFGADLPEAEENHSDAVVRVVPERYREVVANLRDDDELDFDFFDFLTAVDWQDEGLDVAVQLYSTRKRHRVRVKARVGPEDPSLPTISDLYPGADWYERETWELFGIRFEGHPQLVRLLLPEQFEGHPGRKDFPLMTRVAKPWPGRVEGEDEEDEDE
jgi:NADH-quinone oxidoreductase subunit C